MSRLYWIIVVAVFISGCKDQTDFELPLVSIDSPTSGGVVKTSDGLRLMAKLSDNNGLLQYKMLLSGIDSLNGIAADSTFSWVFVEGVPDEASDFQVDETILLPDTTFNGYYQIVLTCLDVEGNESLEQIVSFRIENSFDPEPPQFNVLGPSPEDTLGFGMGFVMSGTVSDNRDILFSEFFLGKVDFSDTVSYVSFPWEDNVVDYTNNYSWYFQVDSSWTPGNYHVYFTAWDDYSGVSHAIPFYVSY